VTTAALVVGAAWPPGRRVVVVEADPFGGVLAARFGLGDTPGLASLAAAARPSLTGDDVTAHVQRLSGGLPVVVGVGSPEQGQAVIRDVAAPLAGLAAAGDVDVVVDCGRVGPGAGSLPLLRECDLVLVVVRPSVDQLRHAAHRLGHVGSVAGSVALLLVGDAPYGAEEVASTLGVEVAGVLAWDPAAAGVVNGSVAGGFPGVGRGRLGRSALARSAVTLTGSIAARVGATAHAGSVAGRVS